MHKNVHIVFQIFEWLIGCIQFTVYLSKRDIGWDLIWAYLKFMKPRSQPSLCYVVDSIDEVGGRKVVPEMMLTLLSSAGLVALVLWCGCRNTILIN